MLLIIFAVGLERRSISRDRSNHREDGSGVRAPRYRSMGHVGVDANYGEVEHCARVPTQDEWREFALVALKLRVF